MSNSEKYWQVFEMRLGLFMKDAGVQMNAEQYEALGGLVTSLRMAVEADLEDAIGNHVDNAPHYYQDGSSA